MTAIAQRYCARCCQTMTFTGLFAKGPRYFCACGEDVTHSPLRNTPQQENDQRIRLVTEIMALAFDRPHLPRSKAYMVGTRDALVGRAMQFSVRNPFELGTEAADAWFAGNAEGQALWRAEAERQAAASETMAQAIQRARRNSEVRP